MNASLKTQEQGFWRTHSEAWSKSGKNQKAYCEQEGISYRSFVYQHSRIMKQSKKSSLHFIEAKPESSVMSTSIPGLQLMLPNGIRIGIGAEVNPVLLQTVLSIAGAVQCLS